MSEQAELRKSIRKHVVWGAAVLCLLPVGLSGWAATTQIAGAVITGGTLVVETSVKKVQHPTGGVIARINVREGEPVREGDLLIRLDDTILKANLAIVTKTLDELDAKQARLRAERDDLKVIGFSSELLIKAGVAGSARDAMVEEQRLFDERRAARSGEKARLNERIGQLKEELQGLSSQVEVKGREVELIKRELEGVKQLWQKQLIPITRLISLEREALRVEGERGVLQASIAQSKGKITEIEIQIAQIDRDLKADTSKELREIQGKVAELVERRVAAEDQLKRIDILAPQDGVVHQLAAHTIGGVITAAEQLMLVVPTSDQLLVEVRVSPGDIDQLRIGQTAMLRFSAFNQRTTPEIFGVLRMISADIALDQKSGAAFYTGRIAIAPEEAAKLRNLKLVPGMPVEAYLQSAQRTVLSYLVKPLEDQVTKSFRER